MRRSRGIIVGAAMAMGAVLSFGASSRAGWRATDAAACRPQLATGFAQFNNNASTITTSNSLQVICPVTEDSGFSKAGATAFLQVDHNNPNASTSLQACVNFEGATGGTCSALLATTSSIGAQQLQGATNWPADHYGYLLVNAAAKFNNVPSPLKGYFWVQP